MIRRKKHLDESYIKYYNYSLKYRNNLLKKSFLKNYQINYLLRFSQIVREVNVNRNLKFYGSQNKLQCPLMYSFSVPNQNLFYSRFYLNKSADRLSFAGYQKK